MVTKEGDMKLLDFSTAKILGKGGFVEAGTEPFFNPFQVSPEQRLQQRYSFNGDVWFLGTMFSEMMAPGTFIYELPPELRGNWTEYIGALKAIMSERAPVRKAPALYGEDLAELLA